MMMQHYDNVPSQIAMRTQKYISATSLKKVPHPPYSLCIFEIFSTVKKHSEGSEFILEDELFLELDNFSKENPKILISHFFRNRKCVYINVLIWMDII